MPVSGEECMNKIQMTDFRCSIAILVTSLLEPSHGFGASFNDVVDLAQIVYISHFGCRGLTQYHANLFHVPTDLGYLLDGAITKTLTMTFGGHIDHE